MKNKNLFKVLGITLLVVVLLTWLLPVGQYSGSGLEYADRAQVGLMELIKYPITTFSIFINIAVLLLVIGGFYGIVNKTGVYKSFLDGIVKKFKGKEQTFLIVVMVVFALLSALTGLTLPLFLLLPMIVSLLLLMGYDKLVALAATIGSIVMGMIGSVYGYFISGLVATNFNLKVHYAMINRIALLVVVLGLFMFFVLKYARKVKKDKKESILEEQGEDALLMDTNKAKKSTTPFVVIFVILLLLVFIGMFPWNLVFGTKLFTDLHTAITSVNIGNFAVFSTILGNTSAFGAWAVDANGTANQLEGFVPIILLLIIAGLIIGWIYSVKGKDMFEGFVEGMKKMIAPAVIAVLVNVILVITVYHPFYLAIVKFLLGLTKGFNFISMTVLAAIGSFLNVDMLYLAQNTIPFITQAITKSTMYPIMAMIFQSIYGLVMLVAPTSVMLMAGLAYMEVPYTKWLKFIWKVLLQILIAVIIIILISMLFV